MLGKRLPDSEETGQRGLRISSRLTAEEVKNLSAASGVAYISLGAILTFLA
jgi:hypothetical protein